MNKKLRQYYKENDKNYRSRIRKIERTITLLPKDAYMLWILACKNGWTTHNLKAKLYNLVADIERKDFRLLYPIK